MIDSALSALNAVPATVTKVEADFVVIRSKTEQEWMVEIDDFPIELRLEGQSISLMHDKEGFVHKIEARKSEPLAPSVLQRIKEIEEWVEGL